MITQTGAVTGLFTTAGHRDEIDLRRGFKEDIWDPAIPPPFPICPRRRRIGISERLDYEGHVVIPLDEEAVRAGIRRLRKQDVRSLAVVFLFSFVNSAHERRVAEIVREVGPQSAGAEPGPICYGRGGTEPTVTDANLVLGYLDPQSFCGGAFRLAREGVDVAIRRAVGEPLGLSVAEAAHGIFRVVNASMANASSRSRSRPSSCTPVTERPSIGWETTASRSDDRRPQLRHRGRLGPPTQR